MTENTVNKRVAEIIGSAPIFTISELAQAAGVTVDEAQQFWRAMGFPQAKHNEVLFSPADVRALEREIRMIRSQKTDEVSSLSMVRALSHITDRLVLWQQEALVERFVRGIELDETSARLLLIDRIMEYIDHMQAQLDYAYRRQIAALIERSAHEIYDNKIPVNDTQALPLQRAVGFVDMVAYTRRSKEIGSRALADLVQSFEYTCRDIIASNGARVVKTIGDAVMYIADDLTTGAKTVTEMVYTLQRDKKMLPVRASLTWGGVLSRSGDVFGSVVNIASRLVDIAPTGTVLCDENTAALLAAADDSRQYTLEALSPAQLQGLGEVNPVIIQRRIFHQIS